MSKRFVLFLALVLTIPLVGCGHKISQGTIVDMNWVPERTWVTSERRRIGNNSYIVPVTHHRNEYYTITIEGQNEEGEVVQATWHVSAEVYYSKEVGDYFYAVPDEKEGTN